MSILVWTCHTGDCILQYYQYICHKGKVPYLNCWRIFCSVAVIVTLLFVLDTYTTAAPFFGTCLTSEFLPLFMCYYYLDLIYFHVFVTIVTDLSSSVFLCYL